MRDPWGSTGKIPSIGGLRGLTLSRMGFFLIVASQLVFAAVPTARGPSEAKHETESYIEFWNREIIMLRSTVAGLEPAERARRAAQHLESLPVNATVSDITSTPFEVEGQEGIGFTYNGEVLFFLGVDDLDKESGETLEQASVRALKNLDEAFQARNAERSWPVIRGALTYSLTALAFLLAVITIIRKIYRRAARALEHYSAGRAPWFVLRLDIRPVLDKTLQLLIRTLAYGLAIAAVYAWTTLSLRRFPYTQPWGKKLGDYLQDLFTGIGESVIRSIPDLFTVFVIVLIVKWVVDLASTFFTQISAGNIRISWLDPDMARATQRIFAAIAWIFAIVVTYPYIPGSNTQAFKGVSVFLGLVVTLSSTGIVNQVMSGLFVVYSRALRTGDWVQVNDTEGEVLEVGLLAAKIRSIEGQEITVPNSLLVSSATKNYTRLGGLEGGFVSCTVTIGYDAPWRQVHSLLLLAAQRTPNVRKDPEPYVLQRQLSDFYVTYTLIARLTDETVRIDTVSTLHAQIQDVFNDGGIQIMSPHYMTQPKQRVLARPIGTSG